MENNSVCWRSPSNIALVKYWGKLPDQIPMNASLSLTLSKSYTETKITWKALKGNTFLSKHQFIFEGQSKPDFEKKVFSFLDSLEEQFTWLKNISLTIESSNTFPHSSGIASSASAMSALALCLMDIHQQMNGNNLSSCEFHEQASIISRKGSGSASRSVYPFSSIWGKVNGITNSSNEYAIDWSREIHDDFKSMQDWIFIVNKNVKSVSSSAGHSLMENHPYREHRITQAEKNIQELIQAMQNNDCEKFIQIVEEEALSLHGLMMSSRPGYILLAPESLILINKIREFRMESKEVVTFSIDAGPNIHLLFLKKSEHKVRSWIQSEFPQYLNSGNIIYDHVGSGPEKILE
ncbi:MAG: diphosphomevalonate decarboxylase [Bacteroidota bacterium]|nr:diphosphomevalonate decarboxylase [Bacteroidota bacterium]